jgi:hypothetical protein
VKFQSLLVVASLLVTLPANARLTSVAKDFVDRTKIFSATRVMAPPTANGSYLMSMFLNQPATSEGTVVATLRWTDEQGPQSRSLALSGNHLPQGTAFPIRVVAHTSVTLETTGTVGTSYDVFIRGVGFWVPGTGTTSLSDYEKNLLLWSNATYPNQQSVLTAPATDKSYLFRVNINEPANTSNDLMCVDVLSVDEYSRNQTQTGCASPNGIPTMMLFPLRVKGGTSVQLVTYHLAPPKWGGSPTYNVTVDAIGF